MIDGGHEIDIDAVIQNIDEAEVVTLHFPILRQTLLVDMRCDATRPPLVRVVPMVNNSQERFASLEAMRPGMPRPRSITMIPWARSVAALDWSGVWEHMLRRIEQCGHDVTLHDMRRARRQLRSLELVEMREAIVGRRYRTVWRARAEEAS